MADPETRSVVIAAIRRSLNGAWMTQLARNLTDSEVGFLRGHRYLILDREGLPTPRVGDGSRVSGSSGPLPATRKWLGRLNPTGYGEDLRRLSPRWRGSIEPPRGA